MPKERTSELHNGMLVMEANPAKHSNLEFFENKRGVLLAKVQKPARVLEQNPLIFFNDDGHDGTAKDQRPHDMDDNKDVDPVCYMSKTDTAGRSILRSRGVLHSIPYRTHRVDRNNISGSDKLRSEETLWQLPRQFPTQNCFRALRHVAEAGPAQRPR